MDRAIEGLIGMLLIFGAMAVVAWMATNAATVFAPPPQQLATLSGHAHSTTFSTKANHITFVEVSTGQSVTAQVVDGNYSAGLVAGQLYNVTLYYDGITGVQTSANCQKTVTVPAGTGPYVYNITC